MIYICEKCGIVYKAEYQPTECESCGCTYIRKADEREVLEIVDDCTMAKIPQYITNENN